MKSNRRQFLRGLGTFAIALPYMPSLLSKEALAQVAAASPGIFIQLISPNAIDDKLWFPQVTNANDWTVLNPHAKRIKLDRWASSGISTLFDKTYASQYKHYTFIRGLGEYGPKPGHHHGALCLGSHYGIEAGLPSGFVMNPTLDKVLEASSKFYGDDPVMIKNLSVSTAQTHGASYSGDGVRSTCYTNPRVVFDLLFGTSTSQDNSQVNVLNGVMGDYSRVKNHPRISAADKTLLEERMDMFADLQAALNSAGANQCTVPTRPANFPNLSTKNKAFGEDADTNAHVDAMVKVCLAGIKCGVTRILVWNEMMPMGLLHYLHHGGSHGGDPNWDAQISYQKWIHKHIFSKFVAGLDVSDGNGGTYLDRTGLVHMLENGGNGILHNLSNAYVLCAGGMNGWLTPGHFYDYTYKFTGYSGDPWDICLPINCLWNSILQSNGLTSADYKTPGQEGDGFGYSSGKWGPGFFTESGYYKTPYQYSIPFASGPLPFMKKAS